LEREKSLERLARIKAYDKRLKQERKQLAEAAAAAATKDRDGSL
jgi:hypothetical protein